MIRPASMLATLAVITGCGSTPFEQRHGTPFVKATTVNARISARGYQIAVAVYCQAQVVNYWCDPKDKRARACNTPPTVTRAEIACPRELELKGAAMTLRAPWGAVYRATSDERGVIDVPIDWAKSGIDPLADGVAAQLAANWVVYAPDGRAFDLKVSPQDVEVMRTAIGEATDTQYDPGTPGEHTVLKAELVESEPLVLGRAGTVGLSITNSGAKPAYRVIARLKSGTEALDGIQLSFGRIDPGKTKLRTRRITVPATIDDRTPLVLANIASANTAEISVQRRFKVGAEQAGAEQQLGVGLDCKLAAGEVSPGERVRVQCVLRNKSKGPVSELRVVVAVAGTTTPNIGPKKLPAGESATLEFVGDTATTAKQGTSQPVVITVTGADTPASTQTLSVRIASLAVTCKREKLTRAQYDAQKKRLQAAFAAGVLTQKELDQYEIELVSCLQ